MRIAIFHNLPPGGGGAKRALYNFVNYLTRSGHVVDVFVPSTANESFLPLKDIANKLQIFPVRRTIAGFISSTFRYSPFPPFRHSLADLEKTQKDIANVINRRDHDVVFIEQDQYTMSPFLLKFIKKPHIYYCQQPVRLHEVILQKISRGVKNNLSPIQLAGKYFVGRTTKIDRQNASFANYILANSYFSREAILRAYGANSFVCYLGVNTETFRPLHCPKEDYVLSIGACDPVKGFDFIVKSLGLIDQSLRPKFVIISNAAVKFWEDYLKQLAIQVGVGLEIKRQISDDELVSFYNRAKLVVYAPYLEPFGLVPLEAMACGTPVVAVREGGVRESVVHNKTGILTERDELIFAEAIAELLANEEIRDRMGQRAIEAVKGFWSLKHAGERLLWHLERCLSTYESAEVRRQR